jgi:transposase-like protein
MNRLDPKAHAQVIQLLCEGMAIRAITRVTGASKNTVAKLLAHAGLAYAECPGSMALAMRLFDK